MSEHREVSVGVLLPPLATDAPGHEYLDLARRTEELGFGAIYQGDHIFGHTPTADCLAMLAAFAAVTTRVELGTSVILIPLREPIVTAKQIATVDALSAGRLRLGVGVGGEIAKEFEALGEPLTDRGRRTDERLRLMQALWSGQPLTAAHSVGLDGVVGTPQCHRPGGPPISVGGRSDAAIERALRHDGWCAYASSAETVGERVEQIRARRPELHVSVGLFAYVAADQQQAVAESAEVVQGLINQDWTRRFDRLSLVGTGAHVAGRVREYVSAGVDQVILIPTAAGAPAIAQQLELLAGALL